MRYQRIIGIMLALFTFVSLSGFARAAVSVIDIATAIANGNLRDEINDNADIGKKICDAGGRPSYECSSPGTIGTGICLSGGRPSYDCSTSISIGQGVCLSTGRPSYDCSSSSTIGSGICLSGGRPSYDCSTSMSIGQGVCLSTGRPSYDCSASLTPAEGLCLAKGQPTYNCSSVSINAAMSMKITDVAWAWDKFYDESKNVQWRCRGRSTGQFSEDEKCAGKTKIDDTWPSMQL